MTRVIALFKRVNKSAKDQLSSVSLFAILITINNTCNIIQIVCDVLVCMFSGQASASEYAPLSSQVGTEEIEVVMENKTQPHFPL